jgi:integrase
MALYNYMPSAAELIGWVESLGDKKRRNRAFIVTLYLTGARVSEVCKELAKKDISIIIKDNRRYGQITLITKKHRKYFTREILIPLFIKDEARLFKMLWEHRQKYDNDILFPFSKVRAWRIVSEWLIKFKPRAIHTKKIRQNKFLNACHYLRHLRSTRLAKDYGFQEDTLKNWHGWSSTLPASVYVHHEDAFTDKFVKYKDK